ncbi:MAG: hypothetical protein NZ853_05205 [Leptospiraceae bacterium]|nr:hypothetical protein [Leptospiraceae bacterium]MDW7976655.1 hypothetical protein [Leptospiraceae bacterium]
MSEIEKKEINDFIYIYNLNLKKFLVIRKEELITSNDWEEFLVKKGRKIPFILFVGSDIEPLVEKIGDVNFYNVRKNKIELFYKYTENQKNYRTIINVNIPYEYYPVFVNQIDNIKKVINLEHKKNYDTIIFSPKIDRMGLLQLRVHFPLTTLVQVDENTSRNQINKNNLSKQRMTDIVEIKGIDFALKNPVYSARYFLRRLEWDRMYEIPIKVSCKNDEVEMILAFIQLMIENKSKNLELEIHKNEILKLKKYYEFVLLILKNDYKNLEQFFYENEDFLNNEVSVRDKLLQFLQSYKYFRTQSQKKLTREEEIQLWEIETLLKFKG